MKWNPFARREAVAAPPVETPIETRQEHIVTYEMRAMLAQQSVSADTRPLQRAIINTDFLLPLHEPPSIVDGRTRLRYLTFRDEAMIAMFTTPERMRAFLREFPELGERVAITVFDGQEICNIGASGNFQTVGIDVGSPQSYEMQPTVFHTLASGRILAAFTETPLRGEVQPQGEMEIGAVPGGLSDGARQAFQEVLQSNGVTRAYFYATTALETAPPELWVSVAVEGASLEAMPELSRQMLAAWIDHWPFNTPLRLTRLDADREDADPRADELIVQHGERIL